MTATAKKRKPRVSKDRAVDTTKPVPYCDCPEIQKIKKAKFGLVVTEAEGDRCIYCKHDVFWKTKNKYTWHEAIPSRQPKNDSLFCHEDYLYMDSTDVKASDIIDADDLA